MHHFPRRDRNEDREAINRFERRSDNPSDAYFDVHQIEIIHDYYIETGNFERALEAIEIGLNQHPMATSLMLRKATLLMDSARFDEAKTILLLLSKIESNDPDVFLHLGSLYLYQSNLEEGLQYLKRAHFLGIDQGEEFEDLVLDICNQLNFYGYYEETIKYIELLDAQFRSHKAVLFEFGVASENLFDFEKALESYKALIEQDPFLENVWYNIGNTLNKDNRFDEAIDAYLYSLAINPINVEAMFNLGSCYAQIGDFETALDYYLEHASFLPFAEPVYPYIADCFEQLENYTQAYKYFNLMVTLNELNSEGYVGMGNCLYEMGDYKGALKNFKSAHEISPESSDITFSIGKCYFSLKKNPTAIKFFKKTILLNEHDTAAWLELYFLRHEISEKDLEKLFSKIDLFENENFSLYYLSVIIWMERGELENALTALKKGVYMRPEDLRILLEYYPEIMNEPLLADFINEISDNDEL